MVAKNVDDFQKEELQAAVRLELVVSSTTCFRCFRPSRLRQKHTQLVGLLGVLVPLGSSPVDLQGLDAKTLLLVVPFQS